MKLWDLTAWHCIETVVGHKSEVWDFDIHPDGQYMISGGSEGEVKGWSINHDLLAKGITTLGDEVVMTVSGQTAFLTHF